MRTVLLTYMVFLVIGLSSCDSWFCPDAEPGYTWEKKDYTLTVPFYPDSLGTDSLYIKFYVDNTLPLPEIIYSSTLDSFRITTDVKGSYFYGERQETLWYPKYDYTWSSEMLRLDYSFLHRILAAKNVQLPQCEPAQEVVEITRLKVEVPRQIRRIKVVKL